MLFLPLRVVVFKRNNLMIKRLKMNSRIDVLLVDFREKKFLKQLRRVKHNLNHVKTKLIPELLLGLNKKRLKETEYNLEITHIKTMEYFDRKIKLYESYNEVDKKKLEKILKITSSKILMGRYQKKENMSEKEIREKLRIPQITLRGNIENTTKYLRLFYKDKKECTDNFNKTMRELFLKKLPTIDFKPTGVYLNLEENLQKKIGEIEYIKEMKILKSMNNKQKQDLNDKSSDIISLCKDYATKFFARSSMILYLSKKFPQLDTRDLESIATKDPKKYIEGRTFNWQILMKDIAEEIEAILERQINDTLVINLDVERLLKIEENNMIELEVKNKNLFIKSLCLNNKISVTNIGIFKNIDLSFLKKLTDNELMDYFSATREDVIKLIQMIELLNLFKFTMLNEEYKRVFFPLNEDFPPPVPPPKGSLKPSPREDKSLDN
jgi:hypothetical protein